MENKPCNISICSINSKYIHSSLSVWYLFESIRQEATEVVANVLETTINASPTEILNKIEATGSTLVALSCYIWNIEYVYALLPEIKKLLPNAKILLGGPEVSFNSKIVMKSHSEVDYIISGEGEKSIVELVKYLSGNDIVLDDIQGLYHRDNLNNDIKPCVLKFDPPSPYSKEYFTALNGRISYIETSRGCPYSCAFCLSGRCDSGNVRFFDLDKSKENIILLANSKTQTIKFIDRTFNCNRKRAKDIWQFIIDNYEKTIPKGVCFHFEIAGDILDDESIAILNNAPVGLMQLEIGMQSFYEPSLAKINRKTNTTILQQNIKRLLKPNNMHIHIDLIAGLPLETYELFKNSFNIGYNLKSHMLQLGFLKILHGTPLEMQVEENGLKYSSAPPYEIIDNNYITKEELYKLHLLEDALERFCNSGRFTNTLAYLEKVHFENPFDFYYNLGTHTQNMFKISLDEYIKIIFEYFSTLKNIDIAFLRDNFVKDRLSTNSTGKLPKCLHIKDDNLKKYVLFLANKYPQPKNTKRGVAILYSENKIIWVDYIKEQQDLVTKKWKINSIDLSLLHERDL